MGRGQTGETFGAYLASSETVYDVNGQQTAEPDGDRATGVSYLPGGPDRYSARTPRLSSANAANATGPLA